MTKKKWILTIAIGAIIGTIGLIMFIIARTMYVPPMDSFADNWFELSSRRSALTAGGGFLMFVGYIGICLIGGISMRKMLPENQAKAILEAKERQEQIKSIVEETLGEEVDLNATGVVQSAKAVYYCQYCGSEVDKSQKVCPNCGAKKTK